MAQLAQAALRTVRRRKALPNVVGLLLALTLAGACAWTPEAATHDPTPRPSPTTAPTPTPEPSFGPTGKTEQATVVEIIDGDTIKVDIGGTLYTVRYIGVDSPETVDPNSPVEWMGPEATSGNERLVGGQSVYLEKDVSETDVFGRLLRYVWLARPEGWLLVNQELVRLGFAAAVSYPPDIKYQDLFRDAQREADIGNRGLWGPTPTPVPTPRPTPTPSPTPVPPPPPPPPPPPAPACHPSYTGACLTPGIGDYDCAGGSGNGPNYVQGPVYVVGYDEYGLDSDGDGVGCE